MKFNYTLILVFFFPVFASAQIEKWTLYFYDIQINCYKYEIENDTVTWAYFDVNTRSVIQEVQSNIGKFKKDVTFDSISVFVREKYPNERVSLGKTETKKPFVDFTPGALNPKEDFGQVRNHFWIGAINYYFNLIATNQSSDTAYYKLSEAWTEYKGYHSPHVSDRVIIYLDSCIKLNNRYVAAYLLKAKLHKENAIIKGMLGSDPHVDVIDPEEVNKASATIKQLLTFDNSMETQAMLDELNGLKNRYKRYKFD